MRKLALEILANWESSNRFIDDLLDRTLRERDDVSSEDRRFLQEIVYGVLRNKLKLDHIIKQMSKKPMAKMPNDVRNALRVALYQIVLMDRVPEHSAVDEALKSLEGNPHTERLKGFVNGLLRSYLRDPKQVAWPDTHMEEKESFALNYSFPGWMLEMFLKRFGRVRTESMLKSMNEVPPLYVCRNPLHCSETEFEQCLREDVCDYHKLETPLYYTLEGGPAVFERNAFKKGWLSVHDLQTSRSVDALDVQDGLNILDACAAPGGKSAQIAYRLKHAHKLVAIESNPGRMKKWRSNMERLGLLAAKGDCLDLRELNQPQFFDRILLDAPCSNLGVLGRRVDARWRVKKQDMQELADLQKQLLMSAYRALAPGGILVYSTCTISKVENEDNASWICDEYEDLSLEFAKTYLPGEQPGDGGFVAKICKAAS